MHVLACLSELRSLSVAEGVCRLTRQTLLQFLDPISENLCWLKETKHDAHNLRQDILSLNKPTHQIDMKPPEEWPLDKTYFRLPQILMKLTVPSPK